MRDSKIPAIESKVIRVVAAAVAMTAFIFISSRLQKPPQTHRQYIFSLACFGAVQKKLPDPQSRYTQTIIVGGNKYHPFNAELYDTIKPGDTLLKKAGETSFLLIRHGDTMKFRAQL